MFAQLITRVLAVALTKKKNVKRILISPAVSGKQQNLSLVVFNLKGTYWDESRAGGPSLENSQEAQKCEKARQ